MKHNKSLQAVELMRNENLSAYAAAKRLNISPQSVYKMLDKLESATLCPCCGQPVPEGVNIVGSSPPPERSEVPERKPVKKRTPKK